jgi:DnaA family protein
MNTHNQLTLGVGLKDEATFSNFFPGKNAQLITALKNSIHGKDERVIYFYGTGGLGCTHLLQASCHEAHQAKQSAVYVPLRHHTELMPEFFEGLETLNLVCVDDVHLIAGKPAWEEALFHAYNRIHDAGGRLIVTANVAPKALGVLLPDMVSRLAWSVVFQVQPLSDKEKLEAFIMRAERRGMTLNEDIGKFILNHCPRHMSTLFAALDVLDQMSLAAQRKLTIPFVKEILQI